MLQPQNPIKLKTRFEHSSFPKLKTALIVFCTASLIACGGEGESDQSSNQLNDRDRDGIADIHDAFPDDPNEHKDTDGDGTGDNTDAYPNDPNRSKAEPKDITAPILSELQSIGEVKSYTPSYIFNSNEAGAIEFFGPCSSDTDKAVAGENTIVLNELIEGFYDNCQITVTDAAGNQSERLSISEFTIIDSTAPSLTNPSQIEVGDELSVGFSFESDEDGSLALIGNCSTDEVSAVTGTNNLTLTVEQFGTYSDCSITVTDVTENSSEPLVIPSFSVVPRYVKAIAWHGETDTLIQFPSTVHGFEYHRSSNNSCDFTTLVDCDDYVWSILSDTPAVGTGFSSSSGNVYTTGILRTGNTETEKETYFSSNYLWDHPHVEVTWSGTVLDNLHIYSSVSFDNKIWVVNGGNEQSHSSDRYSSDIWTSDHGQNWSKIKSLGDSYTRMGHTTNVFDGKIWIVHGYYHEETYGYREYRHNVMSSDDGENWRWIRSGPYPPRSGHKSVVFKDKLWVYGGTDYRKRITNNELTDIWSMNKDGSWTEHKDEGGFPLHPYTVLEFQNSLWMFYRHDIWKSDDGINWTEQTITEDYYIHAGVNPRWVVFKNAIWLVGAASNNDIWRSFDGYNWEHVATVEAIDGNRARALIVHDDKMYLLGVGGHSDNLYTLMSEDGINWRRGYSNTFTFPQVPLD